MRVALLLYNLQMRWYILSSLTMGLVITANWAPLTHSHTALLA